ncbi:hypothetical protein LTS18_010217 [Coniosporium uncinatum]|uniref:Uncharacterized protein n=1 Tax=Coniosporium uncinatum TaxID=93489 RepID=A0ACC3CZQ7_9PEZI|nr:hypothetical protein LTS18_010217 [Coniosporium uncinatum]
MSRILYQTETLNGTRVPASAYILWPWMSRTFPSNNTSSSSSSSSSSGNWSIIAWAHGSSGVFGNCAPSHLRTLQYHFNAPYILALQDYVVVAPDYAGLGVTATADGAPVRHEYIANPAAAHDVFHAVAAARTAFAEELARSQFVVMGHLQGGGAAWASGERQAQWPVKGYLGAVAASPMTNWTELIKGMHGADLMVGPLTAAAGLEHVVPGFTAAEMLTEEGVRRLEVMEEVQGCNSVQGKMFPAADGHMMGDMVGGDIGDMDDMDGTTDMDGGISATAAATAPSLVKAEWATTSYAQQYADLVSVGNGRRRIAGPMLVLQGSADHAASTTRAVDLTCEAFPESEIEYALFEGVSHVPVLNAGQQVWLRWIEDRFRGRERRTRPAAAGERRRRGCTRRVYEQGRREAEYQFEQNFFLEYARDAYELV